MANFGSFLSAVSPCVFRCTRLACRPDWKPSQRRGRFVRSAERAVYAATGSDHACASVPCLYLLLANDFSVSHVADTTNRESPVFYKIAAIWGAHDGSMLLWVFFTAILCAIVVYQNRRRYRDMMPLVLAVLMFDLSFFLTLNVFLSNPFNRLMQIVSDGSMQSFATRRRAGP